MVWLIFFIIACLITIASIPLKEWKHLYYAGIIGLIALFFIDTTLVRLGAFSYTGSNLIIHGLPVFYWLSAFFGGVLLSRFYPKKVIFQFPYIILAVFIFFDIGICYAFAWILPLQRLEYYKFIFA